MKKISINRIFYSTLSIAVAFSFILLTGCSDSKNERVIRWKFKNFDKLTYNFTQKTEVSPMGGIFSGFGMTNTATGKLTITPTSDGKADIVVKDLNIGDLGDLFMQNLKKEGGQFPDMFVRGLKSDGTIEGEISEGMQLFYTGILPIPTQDLKIGESIKIPAQMPMNAFGSQIMVKGYQTLTLKSIEENLYIFENDILINEYDIPEDVQQKHQHEIKGKGEYIFDIEKGYFTKTEVEMKIKMKISDLQKDDDKKQNVIPDSIQEKMPFKMDFGNMEMNFISTVSLDLEKAE
ncbi:hypothetical protein ACE193_17080 [Bernardetia sp. OM2101]|uniref:hypothetical protein n=1 Tax=Bernardetia sp. OM2101 TaxID=3344876 RepID=UPI0035D04ABC